MKNERIALSLFCCILTTIIVGGSIMLIYEDSLKFWWIAPLALVLAVVLGICFGRSKSFNDDTDEKEAALRYVISTAILTIIFFLVMALVTAPFSESYQEKREESDRIRREWEQIYDIQDEVNANLKDYYNQYY